MEAFAKGEELFGPWHSSVGVSTFSCFILFFRNFSQILIDCDYLDESVVIFDEGEKTANIIVSLFI